MAEFVALMVIIIAPLAALDFAALKWGADSREDTMAPRSTARPLGIF